MTIKEIETRSGMERANIRFYERAGLIEPTRLDNGYRDYSENDLQILLRVKLLRSLHISLDEILALQAGSKDLAEILARQIETLDQEQQMVTLARDVCRVMREDRVRFADLDAQKYLDEINRAAKETDSPYFAIEGDELPQVFHPWRRFFARMFDLVLYQVVWQAFLAIFCHVILIARSRNNVWILLDPFISVALMLVFEPLCLHGFGTTPGKAILGLHIETPEKRQLSYGKSLARTWGVIRAGLGYNIPFYDLLRLWQSYKRCRDHIAQPWDETVAYTIKDLKEYRGFVLAGACTTIWAVFVLIIFAQQLPPNRGRLTVAEFAENYNYYAEYLGFESGSVYLDASGKWAGSESDDNRWIDTAYTETPAFHFTIENQMVTSISFDVEIRNNRNVLGSYNQPMILVELAYICAQADQRLFINKLDEIIITINQNTFQDFHFTEADISVSCNTQYTGYADTGTGYLYRMNTRQKTVFI